MFFDSIKMTLLSDTLVPDIFICEYMNILDGDCLKVYIQCLFWSKYNKKFTMEEVARTLAMEPEKIKACFVVLQKYKLVEWKNENVSLPDIKEKELNRLYRLKSSSSPEDAVANSEKDKKRSETIDAVNDMFFQGTMNPSWYLDIDSWFNRFGFEPDVMFALFSHCSENNALTKNYIITVAESWYQKGIKNFAQLDTYSEEYKKFKNIRVNIIKKLKLFRSLTEYESLLVEKWVMDYLYDFDIIELALKKTTGRTNPTFNYIDSIITGWHDLELKTKEQILLHEESEKAKPKRSYSSQTAGLDQKKNHEQRKYDKEFFDNLYENK